MQHILANLFISKIFIPEAGLLTVSKVEVTYDLKIAKVYLTFLENKKSIEDVLKIIKAKHNLIRHYVGLNLTLKYIPKLLFYHDDSLDHAQKIDNLIQKFLSIYKNNLFIELSREGLEDEKRTENYFLSNAHKYNVPIVATNYNLFSYKRKHEATDTLLCIKNVEKLSHSDRQKISAENYFKSSESMIKLFSDLPEAISNTRLIAKKCLFFLEEESASLPKFFNSIEKENSELSKFSFSGLYKKLENYKFSLKQEEFESKKNIYEKRLKYELDVIQKTGYSGYFLIVADFISWAKNQHIPVGPGRGSGAGSLVAWTLGITDLDPIKYDLLFERFLNPDRVTLPDFDIDFCQDKRDKVLKYIVKKYGKKKYHKLLHLELYNLVMF